MLVTMNAQVEACGIYDCSVRNRTVGGSEIASYEKE